MFDQPRNIKDKTQQEEMSRYDLAQQYDLQLTQHDHEVGLLAIKMISTISAGAIVLSVTFTNQLFTDKTILSLSCLYASWILFLLSLIMCVIVPIPHQAWLTAKKNVLWAIYKENQQDISKFEKRERKALVCGGIIVYAAIFFFILGLVSLAYFGYSNISSQ